MTRLLDVRGDVRDMSTITTLAQIFATYKYDSDNFWEVVTELVSCNFEKLSWAQKMDVMKAYSTARRGSNELWEHFIRFSLQDATADPIERDLALLTYINEIELPKECYSTVRLDPGHVSHNLQGMLDSGNKYYVNSVTAENLAYLSLVHPWVAEDEAKVFEEVLRENYAYVTRPSMERIKQMYETAVKTSSKKTPGISDLITEQTVYI